jgi:hypothetical protein
MEIVSLVAMQAFGQDQPDIDEGLLTVSFQEVQDDRQQLRKELWKSLPIDRCCISWSISSSITVAHPTLAWCGASIAAPNRSAMIE